MTPLRTTTRHRQAPKREVVCTASRVAVRGNNNAALRGRSEDMGGLDEVLETTSPRLRYTEGFQTAGRLAEATRRERDP